MRRLLILLLAVIAAPALAQEAVYTYEPPVPAEEPWTESEAETPSEDAFEPLPGDAGAVQSSQGYEMGEMVKAAEGAFGEATESVAKVIEKVFADLGKPNAYIVGREGGGAIVLGLRYGQGDLYSKVEGEQPIYWTGPSVGFDVGADASRTFMLVYNLYDTEEMFHRFPAVEGRAYLVGGISASYHQWKDIVIVPIRLGAGWRLGANIGYLHFSKRGRILPF